MSAAPDREILAIFDEERRTLLTSGYRHESTDHVMRSIPIDLGWGWYILVFVVLAGSTSAVNLTDGLDGLAAGTSAIAFLAYTALATIGWQLSRTPCADASLVWSNTGSFWRLNTIVVGPCARSIATCQVPAGS